MTGLELIHKQLSTAWPILFIIYVYDLRVNTLSEPLIIADVTSVRISSNDFDNSVLCDTSFCLV